MPIGLQNAFATFQSLLDIILFTVKWNTYIIYIDVVATFSRYEHQHTKDNNEAPTLLFQFEVNLNLINSIF